MFFSSHQKTWKRKIDKDVVFIMSKDRRLTDCLSYVCRTYPANGRLEHTRTKSISSTLQYSNCRMSASRPSAWTRSPIYEKEKELRICMDMPIIRRLESMSVPWGPLCRCLFLVCLVCCFSGGRWQSGPNLCRIAFGRGRTRYTDPKHSILRRTQST